MNDVIERSDLSEADLVALRAKLCADRISTTVGAYMVFYSLGSALGAATTTAVYDSAGWIGSAVLGALFATGALLAWGLSARAGHDRAARRGVRGERRCHRLEPPHPAG